MAVANSKNRKTPKWLALVSGNMDRTCGLPLRSFNFEPPPDSSASAFFFSGDPRKLSKHPVTHAQEPWEPFEANLQPSADGGNLLRTS